MTKSKEDANRIFELIGQTLSLEATSGLSENTLHVAEGSPIFHRLSFGGVDLSLANTSGLSKYPLRVAEGQPDQVTIEKVSMGQPGVSTSTQPTVISGTAGIYPR